MTEDANLLALYGTTLVEYLQTASEEGLYRASLLSNSFIEHGLGPEEIVALHSEELERVAKLAPLRERARLYASSLQFLLEVMIAYGIRYKEYTDMKLAEATRDVEQRMALERAMVEEKIRVETEALHSKEDFLSFIAHELRTPLTALRGHIQILQRRQQDQNPERLQRSLQAMAHAVQGLQRMVVNLLEISRTGSEAPSTETLACVDLGAVARAMVTELDMVAEQAGVALELHGTEGIPPVRVNPQSLESVINNLLSNAIKYSRGGQVRVDLSCDGSQVRCAVVDAGIGIAPDDLPHIFDKYYRGTNASSTTQGIGLGLAVSQSAVQRYGGRIEVQSTLGIGSTFTLVLPAATNRAADC